MLEIFAVFYIQPFKLLKFIFAVPKITVKFLIFEQNSHITSTKYLEHLTSWTKNIGISMYENTS